MPLARGYESEIGPGNSPAPVLANPETFGAGIGEAIERAGDVVHGARVRGFEIEKRLTADREAADFQHRFALHRQNMDGIVQETRNNAAPGGAGHTVQVMEANDAARDTLFAGLTDPEVQRRAQAQWDDYAVRLNDGARTFEAVTGAKKVGEDTKALTDIGANRIRQGLDPKAYGEEVKSGYAYIDGLRGVNADVKAAMKRELVDQKYTQAFVEHVIDTAPGNALAMLDAGTFGEMLSPEQVSRLRGAAEVEIRRGEAQAQNAANLRKAEIGQQVGVLEEADRQGIALPEADYDAAIAALGAIDDPDRKLKIEGLRDNARFARIYQGQSPLQREQRLATLKAMQTPGVTEQREMKWLEDKRGALDERFNSDPAGFAIENAPPAMRPPAGAITDPGVLPARAAWADRASAAYGRPVPPLTRTEAQQLGANKAQNEDEVLRLLDGIADPRLRAAAARQIDGQDTAFQHMALINPGSRPTIRNGAAKLKADPRFLTPSATEDPGRVEAIAAWEAQVRRGLKEMGVADQEATLTVARQFVAGVLSHTGGDVNALTRGQLDLATRVALGGGIKNGKPVGGLGNWAGRPFVLPEDDDNGAFGQRVTRWLAGRAKNPPVNPNGTPIAIRDLTPVLVGAGRYRWETPDGRVAFGKDGKPLIMEMGR